MNKYRIHVFGKAGCDKCAVLNQRIDALLAKPEWSHFDKQYHDLGTEDGLVAFAQAECINPQRIPAMLVSRFNEAKNRYEPIPNPALGRADATPDATGIYLHLGLQTDYSDAGKGVLSPRMIASVLEEAARA